MIVSSAILKGDKIYLGFRHYNIIHAHEPGFFKNCTQGFIDENGKFYDREAAAAHAYVNEQIKHPKTYLFSEDVWDPLKE